MMLGRYLARGPTGERDEERAIAQGVVEARAGLAALVPKPCAAGG